MENLVARKKRPAGSAAGQWGRSRRGWNAGKEAAASSLIQAWADTFGRVGSPGSRARDARRRLLALVPACGAANTAKAALTFAAGSAGKAVPGTALVLAEAALRGMAAGKLKVLLMTGVLVAAAFAGAGRLVLNGMGEGPSRASEQDAPKPIAMGLVTTQEDKKNAGREIKGEGRDAHAEADDFPLLLDPDAGPYAGRGGRSASARSGSGTLERLPGWRIPGTENGWLPFPLLRPTPPLVFGMRTPARSTSV